jgi:peptide-methionine (S)-S-oxide reductase
MAIATYGAGCFWGVEEIFRNTPGVISTAVGYMGGALENPSYEDVCTDRTGHAEIVQVTFDPSKVTYEQLLTIFWELHDPTSPNRQGPDVGSQYRSVVFYHTPEQQKLAEASKQKIPRAVTEIIPVHTFWRAEEYHQQYFAKRGGGQCHI